MRILAISRMFLTIVDPLDISVYMQMREVTSLDNEVLVISPIQWCPFPLNRISRRWHEISTLPGHMCWDGIEAYYPRYLSFPRSIWFASAGRRMYQAVKSVARNVLADYKFDIIHAHMGHPDGYSAMIISRELGIPYVVTMQATDLDITVNLNKRCYAALARTFCNAACVIAPTPRLADKYTMLFKGIPNIVGYGINPEDVYLGESDIRARYGNKRIILSVSRLLQTKGIDIMLQALKRIIDDQINNIEVVYLIVGDGPYRKNLLQLVKALGLQRHVEFIGQLPHHKAMEYMSFCDIFVLPSWQETFGLVYIEAMAHGKPVVGVFGQGVDGIVKSGETGLLVKPKDIDSLVDALKYLLLHPTEARRIGERARQLAIGEYTWNKSARKLVKAYKQVLSK